MPIQNIPVMLMMWGTLCLCFWMMWQDHKDNKHAQGIARVRRAETHRKAMRAIEFGKISRANRMSKYHGLV